MVYPMLRPKVYILFIKKLLNNFFLSVSCLCVGEGMYENLHASAKMLIQCRSDNLRSVWQGSRAKRREKEASG